MQKENNTKKHLIFISAIVFLALFFMAYNMYITSTRMVTIGDIRSFYYPILKFTKDSFNDFGQFPHWIPYYYEGTPFFANAQNQIFSIISLFSMVLPRIELAISFYILITFIMAGIFVYALAYNLGLKPKFAFISAIIGMFNGYTIYFARFGGGEFWGVLVWAPLAFLLLILAFRKKNFIPYSIFLGVVLALQFQAGNMTHFIYSYFFIICISLFFLIGKDFTKKAIKLSLIGLIAIFVVAGLSAVKLLPMLEYSKVSVKNSGFAFEQSVGGHVKLGSFAEYLKAIKYNFADITPPAGEPFFTGIFAFILVLFSLLLLKKKNVLLFWILIIMTYLIATGSPLYYLMWKFLPGFNKQHHVSLVLGFIPFFIAVLAGFGASYISGKLTLKEKYLNIFIILIIIAILFNVGYFKIMKNPERPWENMYAEIEQNQLLQYLSKQPGIFRVNNFNTNMVGGYAESFAVPLKIQILYGFNNIWIPEYFNVYLGISHQAPEKFYGMLNTKYVYSNEPLNRTDLKFIRKFEECKICKEDGNVDKGVYGPYLYENKLFLPRAYVVPNSILVVGGETEVKNLMYGLMLDENFNPSNTVIIMGEKGLINNYNIDVLKKFNVVFLTQGSIDKNSYSPLKQYADSGGILLPDIINGKNSITDEDMSNLWKSFDEPYKEINITYFSPNKIIMDLQGEKGFMVLSEKFFMFEGWKAEINNKKQDILRADGISSAVYLNGERGNLVFYYGSKFFKIGAAISLLTLFIILFYSGCTIIKRYKKSKK